ncbi:serine hydrolase domain-containing protein [Chloroflexota bacterium]
MSEEMDVEKTKGKVNQKKSMKVLGKVALRILAVLAGLFGLILVWAFLSYPPAYLVRSVFWGDSDVYDYQRFPSRPLAASLTPFYFKEEPAEEMVQTLFEQNSAIDDLDDFLERAQTQAFIVIQNDTILYERYFNGASRDTIVTSFSCAKQWVSALIGAAIDDGYIQSVDDPITDYLPELAERDPAFAEITIYDLLRMSSGIEYDGLGGLDGGDSKTYYYPDLRKLALEETTVVASPGSGFLYNNYHPLLLGIILERATGMSVTDYLEARIWQPIGMEFEGSWSLDSETSGFEKMESGINGRAIDFAKFGRLFLNNGNWNGTQVLPASWIAESTSPDTGNVGYHPYYKYAWESNVRGDSDYDYYAEGHHGQEIYISPYKNLIIVRNGETYGEFDQYWPDIFYQFASAIELGAGD